MDSHDCADQRSDESLMKNKSFEGQGEEDSKICNGHGEEEGSSKTNNKRKAFADLEESVGGKRANLKMEDNGRGEIPAHHARRPPNGFLLFCKRHRDIVSAKNPNLENRGVTKLLGNWWRTLEEDERDKYKELARQNKEIFIANNPQFTWYKLPAPPLRTLVTRPSNRRPPKLEPGLVTGTGPITPGKLADESQLGGLTSLLSSSLSPPTTPLNASPPLPTAMTAPAPPKKRFLLQTRTKRTGDDAQYVSESDEATDSNSKKCFKAAKKKYKKKNGNSLKYKRNIKLKWKESLTRKMYIENNGEESEQWKTENGCTQQQLIEKIVDSSFDVQKPFQDYDVQRTLDYINTEHTYQKNPTRFWQQQKQHKNEKKGDDVPVQVVAKGDGADGNIISPNLNNNTIVLSAARQDGKNCISYSFNDNNNLIIDYVDPNQRKLVLSSNQTNHDRIKECEVEDGYIPGGVKKCVEITREDCDKMKRLEDQKKPLKLAQDDNLNDDEEDDGDDEDDEDDEEDEVEIPKNCDRHSADFQSILGEVSREIVSMIKERVPEDAEGMAVAKFNVKSRSETDSDESWYDKSDGSPPESPGGRRSKRSCKGQRYEQFIKNSVSKKRSKNSNIYSGVGDDGKKGLESKSKKKKIDKSEDLDLNNEKAFVEKVSEFLSKEKEFADKSKLISKPYNNTSEDLIIKQGTKASDIIQLKLDLELKFKKQADEKIGRKSRETKPGTKKKPISKVQMIKEKKELHIGEFNLNEKIEELPLLSFESFLQKKRQRKKRLLGLKKDVTKSKVMKNRLEKLRARSPNASDSLTGISNKPFLSTGLSSSKPDFADLTTLAETALTLLSLREPR